MADGLEAGQSVARNSRTDLAGAIDFSRNKVKAFVNDTVKGAQSIADKLKHPIKTIRADMVKALRKAGDEEEKAGDAAKDARKNLQDMGVAGEDSGKQISQAVNQAENSLNDMGDAGEDAGSRVSEAIKSALKQSALQLGLSGSIDEMDDASAAQVRLNAVLMQSGAIQEAAVEQAGGLANSTKSLKGVLTDFMTSAGGTLAPALEGIINTVLGAWPSIEPVLLSFVGTLGDGLSTIAPTLLQLGQNLIPSLAKTLGTLLSAASPVLGTLGSLAETVLPPLANIISEVVSTAIPPLAEIFEALNRDAIQSLMPVIEQVAGQMLPVLGMALSSVSEVVWPLISAFMPLLTIPLRRRSQTRDSSRRCLPRRRRSFTRRRSGCLWL